MLVLEIHVDECDEEKADEILSALGFEVHQGTLEDLRNLKKVIKEIINDKKRKVAIKFDNSVFICYYCSYREETPEEYLYHITYYLIIP